MVVGLWLWGMGADLVGVILDNAWGRCLVVFALECTYKYYRTSLEM